MQRLSEDQRASVEKLAREAGTTCEGCGSARLRCGEEARRTHDQGLIGLPVVPQRCPLRRSLPVLRDPPGKAIGT